MVYVLVVINVYIRNSVNHLRLTKCAFVCLSLKDCDNTNLDLLLIIHKPTAEGVQSVFGSVVPLSPLSL